MYGEVSRFRPERFLDAVRFPGSFVSRREANSNEHVGSTIFFLNSEFMKEESASLAARSSCERRGRHCRTGSQDSTTWCSDVEPESS